MMKFKAFKKVVLKRIKRTIRIIKVNIKLFIRSYKLKWKHKKKTYIRRYILLVTLAILTILALRVRVQIIDKSTHTKEVYIADTINTLEQFMYQLRYIESADNHRARRKEYIVMRTSHGLDTAVAYSQYIGFYQMGYGCRKITGMTKYPEHEYWNSEFLQHKSMIIWLLWLKEDLKEEIEKWDKKFYGTFYITESGLMGMSHLIGHNGVKRWLKSERYDLPSTYNIVDGNGKNGTDYLQQLGRYDLKLERFLDKDGETDYEKIDKFVENILENKPTTVENILELENRYIIVDSVDSKKDSITHKLPKIN